MANDYPVDLRADYPTRSSRGWAVLTILLIKFLALIPHVIILVFLGIAQAVVTLVAQVVVAIKGEYPEDMFRFIEGVLRWNTRVAAFALSLTDRYPPFTLRPDPTYPIDVVIERPRRSSRLYALFTLLVEILLIALAIGFVVSLATTARTLDSLSLNGNLSSISDYMVALYQPGEKVSPSILVLRVLVALPHLIIFAVLAFVTFFVWFIVQWIIIFSANFTQSLYLWDFLVGVMRWRTRLSAYTLGLTDRYPPFTFEPFLTAKDAVPPESTSAGPPPPASLSPEPGTPPAAAAAPPNQQ